MPRNVLSPLVSRPKNKKTDTHVSRHHPTPPMLKQVLSVSEDPNKKTKWKTKHKIKVEYLPVISENTNILK